MKEKILIVDDEKDIVKVIGYNLQKEGYRTVQAYDGDEAVFLAAKEHPDLIILDLMLPGMSGLDVCKTIRKDDALSCVPIIMLTAKNQEADKVVGLELGADDYMGKPFGVNELIARVKAVLRRTGEKESIPELYESGELAVDFAKISVTVRGKEIELTSKEFELLKTLIKAKGRVLSRDYLLDTIWGFDNAQAIQTRTVDVHIRTLRKKLKGESGRIVTVKNYGYRFEQEEA